MKRFCPHCLLSHTPGSPHGFFIRKSDGRKLLRFRCPSCGKTFSQATTQLCYRQKKRRLNPRVRELLVSGVSQRRISRLLKISRTTVARKLIFLGRLCAQENLSDFLRLPPIHEMQFDELETFEHTKCKPLSVILTVEKDSRRILGFRLAQMPAKGPLAKISRKKYGVRADHRPHALQELFAQLQPKIAKNALIESDQNPHYTKPVREHFPDCFHETVKGQRGCVTGQGELKKIQFDPLFSLNHTCAMLRANINRLFRRTWCTTKLPARLKDHLEIYIFYHNRILIHTPSR